MSNSHMYNRRPTMQKHPYQYPMNKT